MGKLVLIDGNSILNRAFYGIMGSKMLQSKDGTPTNAVYGFLAILFKILEDIKPEYLVVAFDLKGPTKRHEMYDGYKANRKGMPDELACQMPIIKEILRAMKIDIVEKQGYEGDDILGTLSVYGEKQGLDVTILSGDRDTFQLATDKVTIRIPRTKMGKTEVEDFNKAKVEEIYNLEPKQLIEVKGLQGDTSDNIPGVPGIGEKTALKLIQEYKNIENLYKLLEEGKAEDVKGKTRERIIENKDLAFLSKELGTININAPIEENLEEFKVEEWDKPKVLKLFKELNFNRYIERFNLASEDEIEPEEVVEKYEVQEIDIDKAKEMILKTKELFYHFSTKEVNKPGCIIKKEFESFSFYNKEENKAYFVKLSEDSYNALKEIFEDKAIKKYGYKTSEDYILLKQLGILPQNIIYDAEVAVYDLDPSNMKYKMQDVAYQYLDFNMEEYLNGLGIKKQEQINLFEENADNDEYERYLNTLYCYLIQKLYEKTTEELEKLEETDLFNNIEMPLVEVLSEMQYEGIQIDKDELEEFGVTLKQNIEELTQEIYTLSGTEFNINSPKQLGEVLFEKLELPVIKKTKTGYSTDVDVLEKLKKEHPVIEKILEYRSLTKLNSTYVEGLKPYINPVTGRIHSYFHQTITATGRISSTEPNLQNIPTRIELGKQLRRAFKPKEGYLFIDADYSQIELRVLAHISNDEHMIEAFNNNEDIHKQAAASVFKVPINEVTKEQRTHAKAVNFGIVYGISDFGLGEQIGVSRKKAKEYIDQYLEKYSGIKQFMSDIVEEAKEKGYVETLFKRRRYIPELKSKNFNIRQFGARAAMNTPIQGTAADIMKIAMIDVFNKLKERKLKSKLILQIHDELLIETKEEEKEEVKNILKTSMENAIKLKVPLRADVSEAYNWYDLK
ncbi:MAG: DNA polymerase I [Clostridia bacterium]